MYNNQRSQSRGRGVFRNSRSSSQPDRCVYPGSAQSDLPSLGPDLDPQVRSHFMDALNHYEQYKDGSVVDNAVVEIVDMAENPYKAVLKLLLVISDSRRFVLQKLKVEVMNIFKEWLNSNARPGLVDSALQLDAFRIARREKNMKLAELISHIFGIKEDKERYLEIVRNMIRERNYADACMWATMLELKEFSLEDFVIPLFFQINLPLIVKYLKDNKDMQIALVQQLDSLLERNSNVKNNIDKILIDLQIADVEYHKINARCFRKTLDKLIKEFAISPDVCPNIMAKKSESTLNFFIYKRYTAKAIGDESFMELVEQTVRDDVHLQLEAVRMISQCGSPKDGLAMAKKLNLDPSLWPTCVVSHSENLADGSIIEESWDAAAETVKEFHKLSLNASYILFVDTPDIFSTFLNEIQQYSGVIGLDAEWKPIFQSNEKVISLLQLATRCKIYILDILTLKDSASDLWNRLVTEVMNNEEFLKIGFDLRADQSMLRSTLPAFENIKFSSFLDLSKLYKQLEALPSFKLPFTGSEEGESGAGLSSLTYHCLGKPLDKAECISDWEKRPLRPSQVEYAALDAFCLIEIYDVFKERVEQLNLDFDEFCSNFISRENHRSKKKAASHQRHRRQNNYRSKIQ